MPDKQTRRDRDADVTLKIPRPLYERLKQVIEGSGFHSVTEFAVYVLRDLVSHHEHPDAPPPQISAGERSARPSRETNEAADAAAEVEPLSPEEIEAIRRRLESLGYL